MKWEQGSVADIMAAGLCMLAMTVVMLAYMGNAGLINTKASVNQTARKYILRMETTGRLAEADRIALVQELESLGVTELELEGTTMEPVGYGETIVLQIRGRLEGGYEIQEKRVSTAKH